MDRRSLLSQSAGMVGLGAMLPAAAAYSASPASAAVPTNDAPEGFDPNSSIHNAEVLARMNLGIHSGSHYGWFKGRVFAVIGDDKVITPLFDLEGFGANRKKPLGDSRFQSLHREVGYYKDIRTGKIMETWENPFLDGEVCEVSHIHNDPVNAIIGPTINAKLGEDMANQTFPLRLPWTFMGDLAMTSFDVNTQWRNLLTPEEWPRESTGEFVRVSEYLQFIAKREDIANWRNVERIAQHGAWQRIGSWLPWMLMGGKPGHLFYRSFTKSLNSYEELPQDIRDYTEKNYPIYTQAPAEWVEPNVTSFEVYKLENKPKGPAKG